MATHSPNTSQRSASTPPPPLISVLLDRSGSMVVQRAEALDAVNGFLAEVKAEPALASGSISISLFDTDIAGVAIDHVREGEPASDCAWLTEEEYVPRGRTPLLDAVGIAVARLDVAGPSDVPRILVIITDGLENASREHTREAIAELLGQRQAAGWLVMFLGAGIDAWSEAASLGIDRSGAAEVSLHCSGEIAMTLGRASRRYVAEGKRGVTDEERAAMAGKR